jgi:hypothetical protein
MAGSPYSPLTEIIPFLYLQGSALALGWMLYRGWFRTHLPRLDALLAAAVALCAWMTGVQLALGLAGHLHVAGLIFAQTAALAVVLVAFRKRSKDSSSPDTPDSPASQPSFLDRFLPLLFTVYWVGVFCRLPFAFPYRVDVMAYHLPFVVYWMQSHGLGIPGYLAQTAQAGYPAGHELLVHWFMAPLRSDLFSALVNGAFLGLSGPAMAAMGEKLRAPRWAGWLAALLLLSCPLMEWLAQTHYVEPAYLFFLLGAANFGLLAIRRGRRLEWVIFCLAFGLAGGIKTTHVAYGSLLLLFLVLEARREGRKIPWPRCAVTLGAAVLALSGMWYLRNGFVFGNPLHPFTPGLLLDTLRGRAEGHALEQSQSLMTHLGDPGILSLWLEGLRIRAGGWAWILLGATLLTPFILAGIFLWRRRQAGREAVDLAGWALLALPFLILYAITPWQIRLDLENGSQRLGFVMQAIRYGLPWLAFALLLLARLARGWTGKGLLMLGALWTVLAALTRTLQEPLFLVPGQDRFLFRWNLLLALAGAALLAFVASRMKARRFQRPLTLAFLAILLAGTLYCFTPRHNEARCKRQDERYARVLLKIPDEACRSMRGAPAGTRMFFWGSLAPYAFYGRRLDLEIAPGSSRDETQDLRTAPWQTIQDARPDIVYLRGGKPGVRSLAPTGFWDHYHVYVDGPEATLIFRKGFQP